VAESSDVHGVLADTEGFASTADGPSSTTNHEPGNELRKPITPEVLIAVVRKVFSSPDRCRRLIYKDGGHNGEIKVNASLLTVVRHDWAASSGLLSLRSLPSDRLSAETGAVSAPLSGLEQRYVTAHATLPSYSVDVVEFTTN